jgi:hypothetical protein
MTLGALVMLTVAIQLPNVLQMDFAGLVTRVQ